MCFVNKEDVYKFGFYGVASDILSPKGPVRGVAWSRTVFNPASRRSNSLASAETVLKESDLWTRTDILISEVVVPRSPIPFLLRALKNLPATLDAESLLWGFGSDLSCKVYKSVGGFSHCGDYHHKFFSFIAPVPYPCRYFFDLFRCRYL